MLCARQAAALDAAVKTAADKRAAKIYRQEATMEELFGRLDGALALDAIIKTYKARNSFAALAFRRDRVMSRWVLVG